MNKMLSFIIPVLAWILFIYQMVITQVFIQSYMENQIVHMLLVGVLLSLCSVQAAKKTGWKIFWGANALAFIIVCGYIKLDFNYLEMMIGFPEPFETAFGAALLVILVIATYKSWGKVFPTITILALAYFFFGHLLPEPLYHSRINFPTAISFLSLGFGTGIFGSILGMIVEFGFLLVLFGALLEAMGANDFFLEMGKLGGKISRGGPAQTAIIGSSLVGMASGSALANVMITGAFTIPTMKRFGYKPETAGAIEAVASAGSQIMPPIMGATAFLMAAFLGVPFPQVMIAAFVPAVLYYLAVGVSVELIARRMNISAPTGEVNKRLLLERAAVFLIPLGLLTVLLVCQYSPGYTAFYSILLVLAIGYARKSTRPSFKKLSKGIVSGVVSAAKISVVVASVAVIAQVVITTGLGTKLAHVIFLVSGGHLFVTLIMAMILCIFLGCGVPSSAAYALVAILVAPAIVKMGIDPFQIHFFCLYFAVISCITPPVALATLGATSIAESDYTKTGWEALKLSISGYIIPFFVVFNSAILLRSEDILISFLSIGAAIGAIFCICATMYGYLYGIATTPMRMLSCVAAVFLGWYVFSTDIIYFFSGVGCGLTFLGRQYFLNKKQNSRSLA